MKRSILLFIGCLLVFNFTACGINDLFESANSSTAGTQESVADSNDDNQENSEDDDSNDNQVSSEDGDGDESILFVVTFDTVGGSTVEPKKVEKGGRIEKPTDPIKTENTKYEYAFAGWYFGAREWNFETDTVSEDITLTAKWNIKSIYTEPFLPSD